MLAARRAATKPVAIVSLALTTATFGYTLFATDLIAAKGVLVTYFAALIVAIGIGTIWFAGRAIRRCWIR